MVEGAIPPLLAAGAATSAFAGGWLLWSLGAAWRRRVRHRAALVEETRALGPTETGAPAAGKAPSLDEVLIAYGVEVSQRLRSPLARPLAPAALRCRAGKEPRRVSRGA